MRDGGIARGVEIDEEEVQLSEKHYEKLRTLRFQKSMQQIENPLEIKFLKKEIAQLKTLLNEFKLDNKVLGSINPNEILNFHSIIKGTKNYLCIINSDGKFKKVLVENKMKNQTSYFGRLENFTPVIIEKVSNSDIGKIINVRIDDFNKNNLFGVKENIESVVAA